MKYKFAIWWKGKGALKHMDTITVEADSERDAMDEVAQKVTDLTQIELVP